MLNIYVSVPVNVRGMNRDILYSKVESRTKELASKFKTNVYYWRYGTKYTNKEVFNCDVFVYTSTNNNFKTDLLDLPSGVRIELLTALELGKKVYFSYINAQGEVNLYKVLVQKDSNDHLYTSVKPIAGSTPEFRMDIEEFSGSKLKVPYTEVSEEIVLERVSSVASQDRRLLMLLKRRR